MRAEDRVRLHHMLDAACDAAAFVRSRCRDDLDGDRQLVLALVKSVEIIGEAAAQISPDTQAEVSGLPWRDIVGMRHRLVHAYYDINLEILWRTATVDLPPLMRTLRAALAED